MIPHQWRIPFVLLGGLAFVLFLSAGAALLRGARWMIGALAIALTLLLGVYGAYSSYRLSFLWPDVAREKMIFVQTSTDAGRVLERLEQASIRRGGGLDLPIWYDNETIWAWYLRRFTNKQQAAQQITTPPGPEIQAVLMLQENIDANPQNLQNLTGFRIQRYPLRWWFPNEGNRLPDDWLTRPLPEDGQPPEDWPLLMRLLRSPFRWALAGAALALSDLSHPTRAAWVDRLCDRRAPRAGRRDRPWHRRRSALRALVSGPWSVVIPQTKSHYSQPAINHLGVRRQMSIVRCGETTGN